MPRGSRDRLRLVQSQLRKARRERGFFGGLEFALPHYPRLAWLHVPTVLWGCAVNLAGWVCPLTPLENRFRGRGARAVAEGTRR
ncbi:MAG TPA: DUF2784 family protein [Myxococcales bacterium]|nr:DUF2784 family protein [Myxococcales bacterium]HIL79730.1 DUF2784 family protein [Myxococcales bacterium]